MRSNGRIAAFLLVALLGVLVGAGMLWLGLGCSAPPGAGTNQPGSAGDETGAATAVPAVSRQSQDAITAAIARVGPAVVNINTTYPSPAQDPRERMLRDFMGMPTDPLPPQGKASGIIIDGKKGYVLTNAHVVRGAAHVEVILADRRALEAQVVGMDPLSDIALLKVGGNDLPSATLGSAADLPIGSWVIAIGNPWGYENSATVGVISAKDRQIKGTLLTDLLQTDAAINRGNSGGALVDLNGDVVGIPTAMIPYAQGIGFAVSVDVAKQVAERLIATGKVPWLGISHGDLSADEARQLQLPEPKGSFVASVVSGGPAAQAGIRPGDVVLRIGDHEIGNGKALGFAIRSYDVGERVAVVVWRDGRERKLTVTLGAVPTQ
jgi:serine protease Do